MSFVLNNFDDPAKWVEYIEGAGTVINRTPDTFQTLVSAEGDKAGLITTQPISIIGQDLTILTDCNSARSGMALMPTPGEIGNSTYFIVRDRNYGQVQAWLGGILAFIPDPVPINQQAELRITIVEDPLYPLGLISFFYEGTLLYQEEVRGWIAPSQYVYLYGNVLSVTAIIPGTNNFQAFGYIPPPPPSYNLSINSNPTGIPFTIKEVGMSEIIVDDVIPWSGVLEETNKEVEVPSNVIKDGFTHNFEHWEDGSTNPIRTFSLTSDLLLFATYKLQIITALEVHAFLDSVEVTADGFLVETGFAFQTPITIEVPPGSYTIRLTYLGVTKEYTANPAEGETIRIDGQMTPPKPSIPSWLIAAPPIVAGLLLSRWKKK